MSAIARRRLGTALVLAQFALLMVLGVLAFPAALAGGAPVAAWLLGAAGGALGIWAVACNRPGNFNIRPTPKEGGHMVQLGPYRWIRHPMYTALMACALALAWISASPWGWGCMVALAAVLAVKAWFEERWMLSAHPGYAAYRERTGRFLPGWR